MQKADVELSRGSPLFLRYLKKYQDNPESLVFAPLAEAYRKAGMIEEAVEIAKEGLGKHPEYISGQVALARCYFDKRMYETVRDLMHKTVSRAPDNILALRLLADSERFLGNSAEALKYYKTLLYFSPSDQDLADRVADLEEQIIREKGVHSVLADEDSEAGEIKFSDFAQLYSEPDDYVVRPAKGALTSEVLSVREKRVKLLEDMLQRVQAYRTEMENVCNEPV